MKTINPGQTATLTVPYKGYHKIELIEKYGYQWLVKIIDSGLELNCYEDEFEID